MSDRSQTRNRAFMLSGLGVALLVAIFLSPFASSNPDGLNRVAEDHGFSNKATEDAPANRLPFHSFLNGYAVRGVPDAIATPLAGLAGTLVTFGLAWGAGKLLVKGAKPEHIDSDFDPDSSDSSP
jgi:cobalt/nickel transport protein